MGKAAVSDRYNDLNHKSEFRAVQDSVPACSSGLRAGLKAKCCYNYEQSFEVLTFFYEFLLQGNQTATKANFRGHIIT